MQAETKVYVRCPECKARHEDLDGLGFVYCDICGTCTHPSADGDDQGYFHCSICGDCVISPGSG